MGNVGGVKYVGAGLVTQYTYYYVQIQATHFAMTVVKGKVMMAGGNGKWTEGSSILDVLKTVQTMGGTMTRVKERT